MISFSKVAIYIGFAFMSLIGFISVIQNTVHLVNLSNAILILVILIAYLLFTFIVLIKKRLIGVLVLLAPLGLLGSYILFYVIEYNASFMFVSSEIIGFIIILYIPILVLTSVLRKTKLFLILFYSGSAIVLGLLLYQQAHHNTGYMYALIILVTGLLITKRELLKRRTQDKHSRIAEIYKELLDDLEVKGDDKVIIEGTFKSLHVKIVEKDEFVYHIELPEEFIEKMVFTSDSSYHSLLSDTQNQSLIDLTRTQTICEFIEIERGLMTVKFVTGYNFEILFSSLIYTHLKKQIFNQLVLLLRVTNIF